MKKIKMVLFCVLVILPIAAIVMNCSPSITKEERKHYIDTTLERLAQIEKCASCHKEAFENWKIGPHANAFIKLEEHDLLVDTSNNFPKEYNSNIESIMKDVCISCHTGQNIYETNFKGVSHNCSFFAINKDSFPNAFKQAISRDISRREQLISGVDCITCHAQNGKVVTNINSEASDTLGLIKSKLFSSNANCFSCHHHQVSTMQDLVKVGKLTNEISCVSCHQEYTGKGNGTHYFYWRNDHKSKNRPSRLNIFECAKIEITNKDGAKNLKFNWTNTLMPHGYSECGEAKCVVKAILKNGSEKIMLKQLLNRKDFFDKIDKMSSHFKVGENGNEFLYKSPIVKEVLLKNYSSIKYFKIEGYVKPQYWSTNKEFIQVFSKEVKL